MTDRRNLARVPWRRLTTRLVYENPWIRVREDQVALPDGQTTLYGVVECAGCVGVLPFLDAETVVLVGQYRYVAGDFFWEMPTGATKPGETEEAAVQRELAEEAGYEADRLVKLCAYHTGKSVVEETADGRARRDQGIDDDRRGAPRGAPAAQLALRPAISRRPAPSVPGAAARPPRSRSSRRRP